MGLIMSRHYVTAEVRSDAVFDVGGLLASKLKAAVERHGIGTLGEGVIDWHRIGDLRTDATAEGQPCLVPGYLRDDDWLVEIKAPVIEP